MAFNTFAESSNHGLVVISFRPCISSSGVCALGGGGVLDRSSFQGPVNPERLFI